MRAIETSPALRASPPSDCRLSIVPACVLSAEPVEVRALGFESGERVRLSARAVDDAGQIWESTAVFTADDQGCVDPALQTPLAGSYMELDADGLFWSMNKVGRRSSLPTFARPSLRDVTIALRAEGERSQRNADAELIRRFLPLTVTRCEVDELAQGARLRGRYYAPADGRDTHAAVLVLGGRAGRLKSIDLFGAAFAARGYAALALEYAHDAQVALEHFEVALQWLSKRASVPPKRIAIFGSSRGAEAALLSAAHSPTPGAVIANRAPASMLSDDAPPDVLRWVLRRTGPAWTLRGESLEFAPLRPSMRGILSRVRPGAAERAPSLPTLYDPSEEETVGTPIPIESIRCPIFLLAGSHDSIWPSARFAALLARRAQDARHPDLTVRVYEGAGHLLQLPHLPAVPTTGRGSWLAFGGTRAANARADREAWADTLRFLDRTIGARLEAVSWS